MPMPMSTVRQGPAEGLEHSNDRMEGKGNNMQVHSSVKTQPTTEPHSSCSRIMLFLLTATYIFVKPAAITTCSCKNMFTAVMPLISLLLFSFFLAFSLLSKLLK